MSKDAFLDYDKTAANNTDCGGVDTAENSMQPSDVNNFCREIMSHIAGFADGTDGISALTIQNTAGTSKYKFYIDGTTLTVSYNGTDILKLESDGHLTAADDVTAFGTV
jgi:hypothetical protein